MAQQSFFDNYQFADKNVSSSNIQDKLKTLRKKSSNKKCADCNKPSAPYVVCDFGVFICTDCSSVHRGFYHKVKSIVLDKFNQDEIKFLQQNGNKRVNTKYLAKFIGDKNKILNSMHGREQLIKSKYIEKSWYDPDAKKKKKKKKNKKKSKNYSLV